MAVSATAAIIGAAVIGAGSAAYSQSQQKKLAEEDRKRREAAAATAKEEADRIARETKPEEEGLGETKFGVDSGDGTTGTTQDFLVPKTSALGGATGRSGLGFKV